MRIARGISVTNTSRPVGITYDADATAFFTAASITDTTQKSAVNTLVLSLKSANIWTKMKALYPIVGGSASSHAVNLKQPGTYNLSFATGWTHSSTGMTPNGATYANTFVIVNTNLINNSTHLSIYSKTNSNNIAAAFDIGVSNNASSFLDLSLRLNDLTYGDNYNSSTNRLTASNTNSQGFFINNRTSSTVFKLFKNSNQLGTTLTTASSGYSLLTTPIYIGCLNNNGTAIYYTNREYAFSSIGDGLTDTEALSFYNAVQTYQTTLGRQV
jgi:hypothetical protein